ncbi:MAG: rhomboid family intramembrane serine protease [Bacteroidota bacterium]
MPLSITLAFLIITVIISFYAFGKPMVQARLMMNPYNIRHKGQYERFITSGFIHKDHMHLIFNMFSFTSSEPAVERDFVILFGSKGNYYFILLYLMAIAVSDLPTYFKQQNNPGYNSLGASGGVAAVVFAFIILEPMQYLCIFLALCMPGFVLGSLYIIYSYFQSKRANDHINHDAHLYGSLFGLLFCIIIYPVSIVRFYEQVSYWVEHWFV